MCFFRGGDIDIYVYFTLLRVVFIVIWSVIFREKIENSEFLDIFFNIKQSETITNSQKQSARF